MRAITVQQPWAWLIAEGHKPVENRTCGWMFRGAMNEDVAIHAGKSEAWFTDHAWVMVRHAESVVGVPEHRRVTPGEMSRGAIVCVARLVAIEPAAFARRRFARDLDRLMYVGESDCLVLERVRKLAEPVACRGMQGLWTVPEDVARRVAEQLGVWGGEKVPAGVGAGVVERVAEVWNAQGPSAGLGRPWNTGEAR